MKYKDIDHARILTLDFETYYSVDYSLRKLPNFEYITDPRFKAHGLAVKMGSAPGEWVPHDALPSFFASVDWSITPCLFQRAVFDAMIMFWQYNVVPGYILDTQGLGNMLVRPFTSHASMESMAQFYGHAGKVEGGAALVETKGIRDLDPEMEERLAEYAIGDVDLTRQIFDDQVNGDVIVPDEEFDLIDMHGQLYLRELMKLDETLLSKVKTEHVDHKAEVAARLRARWPEIFTAKADPWTKMRSNPNVAKLIVDIGELPPRKRSKTTGKLAYAFAKPDLAFQALKGKSDDGALIVEAKTLAGSSILESRIERFLLMSQRMRGFMHPLLQYYGAATGRSSGSGDMTNFQNLPKNPEEFRHCLVAPEGHSVLVGDSANVEARGIAWLAQDTGLLDIFKAADVCAKAGRDPKEEGLDVYSRMAAKINTTRKLGKMVVLGCSYLLSENGFVRNIRAQGDRTEERLLRDAHAGWTAANQPIINLGYQLWNAFEITAFTGKTTEVSKLALEKYRDGVIVWLPSGRAMIYGGIKRVLDNVSHSRGKLWAGITINNAVQGMCRDLVFQQILQAEELHPYLWLLVHDEANLVVPDELVEKMSQILGDALCWSPPWAGGLPVYGDAKAAKHLFKD